MAAKINPKIMVLGGGFGGLETAFYLRMKMPEEADITLISDKNYFLFKPNSIYVPFGLDPERLKLRLNKPTRHRNISFINAPVREFDPEMRTVQVEGYKLDNYKFHYDYLVIATGAGMRAAEVPGLNEHAVSIWTPEEMLRLRGSFLRLLEKAHAGERQRVLFLIPPNNKHAGPLYEISFMLDTWLRRKGARNEVDITFSTFESGYIQVFGPRLNEIVSEEFERRAISGFIGYEVDHVAQGEVVYKNGERLPFDLLVSFPPYVAAQSYPGLKSDERGFISTCLETRQVVDHPEIYAVGDAGDFPIKQAHLAFLEADAAAEHLGSQILGAAPAFDFDPVSVYVMEQLDKATFAQVPLRVTGVPEKPIEVRTEAGDLYRVGSSGAWRLGKKLMGVYLPWRFDSGSPFHSGLPWRGMEAGLKAASGVLSR